MERKLPKKYSKYVNKIGHIKGRTPRSMASPYYNIELEIIELTGSKMDLIKK